MKVYVLPADLHGCGHYRLIWPADVLRKKYGVDVVILPPGQDSGLQAITETLPDGSKKIRRVGIPQDADVLVVQRPGYPLQPDMIDVIRSNGVAVVVDMDDDMSSMHPENIAFHLYRPSNLRSIYSWKHAAESCRRATLVTTSTRALQKVYAKHGRGVVIDNYIPEVTMKWEKPVVGGFGWAGTVQTHPGDLQITGRAPRDLTNEGFEFRVVGPGTQVQDKLKLDNAPACTGSVPLDQWVKTIGQTYDVGIIPLEPSTFNTAKSRLKGIEHMAAGVPWIASPREEYRRLQRESGCGLLADTPKQWYSQLKLMLTDDVLRKEQADMGRQYMETQTIQANAWRWAEAWETALKIERG